MANIHNSKPLVGPSPVNAAGIADDPRIGAVIADRYLITRLLGRGGMGGVYEARHTTIERRFAVKFLLPEFARNQEMLRRFENEAKGAGRLENVHIAAVLDFGRAPDGSPFLVMEYLSGQNCAALLAKTGPLSVQRATNITYQACLGLSVAHQAGIVHRDIKPENLFVLHSDEGDDLVKILDFGIAKLRNPDASAITGSGVTIGTVFYMSPEQIRDSASVDARTDVWSLGVLLYELLTSQRPFVGKEVSEVIYQVVTVEPRRIDSVRPELPRALADIVHSALHKDPARRVASPQLLAAALRPFTNRPSLHSPGPSMPLAEMSDSGSEAMHRGASTSQLGNAALPAQSHSSRPGSLWSRALLAAIVLGLVVVVVLRIARSRDAEPLAAGVPNVVPVPLVASTELARPIEQVQTASSTSAAPPRAQAPRAVRVSQSVVAPSSSRVSATSASTKSQQSTTPANTPITIDPNNPF